MIGFIVVEPERTADNDSCLCEFNYPINSLKVIFSSFFVAALQQLQLFLFQQKQFQDDPLLNQQSRKMMLSFYVGGNAIMYNDFACTHQLSHEIES